MSSLNIFARLKTLENIQNDLVMDVRNIDDRLGQILSRLEYMKLKQEETSNAISNVSDSVDYLEGELRGEIENVQSDVYDAESNIDNLEYEIGNFSESDMNELYSKTNELQEELEDLRYDLDELAREVHKDDD